MDAFGAEEKIKMELKTGLLSMDGDIENADIIKCKWFNIEYRVAKDCNIKVGDRYAPEVIIVSNTEKNCERAFRLLIAILFLIDKTPDVDFETNLPSYKAKYKVFALERIKCAMPGVDDSIRILQKASYSLKIQNSIFKYKVACLIHSNNTLQLDPNECDVKQEDYFIDDRIRYTNAIVVLYSVVEELNFGINLKSGEKSYEHGNWNQKVLIDLQERLTKGKINIDDPILWIKRNKPTKIEKKRAIENIKASWSKYNIRDGYIRIEDAIDFLRIIRNKVAAHNLKIEYKSISIYDVENANFLAKRLILESIGLWSLEK